MVMMMIGIGGLIFNTFKEGGWGGRFANGILESNHPAVMLVAAVIVIGLAWACLSGRLRVGNKTSPIYDLPVYALIIAGIYFTIRWILAA